MKKYIALGIVVLVLFAVGAAMAANVEVKFLNKIDTFLDFYVDGTFKCTIGPGAYYIIYVAEGVHNFKACERGTNSCIEETGNITVDGGPYTWTITLK